jgi:peptide-methionine (S)-S-oxide reductase
MKFAFVLAGLAAIGVGLTLALPKTAMQTPATQPSPAKTLPKDAQTLVLGAGCFWCVETIFEDLIGVLDVESGYAGGAKPGVTYAEVCTGTTGHAEVIKIAFDPKEISREDLLRLFFVVHDPTTLNRQGPDTGTQYRSAIFVASDEEKAIAERIRKEIVSEKIWKDPIVTTIEPLKNYTRAEDYHQDYFVRYEKATPLERAGMNAGYCAAIIEPKVKKFREKYAAKLKKKG